MNTIELERRYTSGFYPKRDLAVVHANPLKGDKSAQGLEAIG